MYNFLTLLAFFNKIFFRYLITTHILVQLFLTFLFVMQNKFALKRQLSFLNLHFALLSNTHTQIIYNHLAFFLHQNLFLLFCQHCQNGHIYQNYYYCKHFLLYLLHQKTFSILYIPVLFITREQTNTHYHIHQYALYLQKHHQNTYLLFHSLLYSPPNTINNYMSL